MSAKNGSSPGHHPERGSARLKTLDRLLGVPLILFLGLFRRTGKRPPSAPARIACLHTAAIGDTVLSSALVQDLKQAFPAAEIVFFTGASNFDTACLIPNIDSVIKLPIKNPLQAVRRIRSSGAFDLWLDLGPWPRLNAVLSRAARSAFTLGFRTRGQYRHYAYDLSVEHRSDRHELENYRALLGAAGIQSGGNLPTLKTVACSARKGIVAHLFPGGSRSYLKEWPIERWSRLLGLLVQDGYSVTLTGTKVNRDLALAVREETPGKDRVSVAAGSLDLAATAALLACSELVISVDTGIMHMASALNCNLIALHGPTLPERWGPLNSNAIALTTRESCSPCLSLGFESDCVRPECMLHISVNDVYQASRKLLGR